MTDTAFAADSPPLTDLYTRNGFAGPTAVLARRQYTPAYLRVEGDYTPQRLQLGELHPEASDPRALPVTILRSPRVRLEVWHRSQDLPYALRDVHHDQVFYVLEGHARLETDFGVLDLRPLDMVRISRAVSLRLANVDALTLIILATANPVHINPENAAVLSPADVDTPRPYDDAGASGDEHELLIRHGDRTTSYFYADDPLPITAAAGAPMVQRFNLADVRPLGVPGVAAPPSRLMDDPATETMVYYLGARESGQPPVHHNVDYDEIGIYCHGPGAFGTFRSPGDSVWVPKGVIHHGAEENVAEGYVAWLIETRAHLELTTEGRRIARLADAGDFDVHESIRDTATAV